jgi:hypothetical protein
MVNASKNEFQKRRSAATASDMNISQMEILLRLPRLRDCFDGVDEVLAPAVLKRGSKVNRRWFSAQAGVRP